MQDRSNSILPNILEAVGETPMVRLNRVPQKYGLQCEVVAKCEFLNPGGSVKDRIGVRMVKDAEASGRIVPGRDTLVEPTSGNTGVGLSMAAAVKGYKMIITMPVKMSKEKQSVLQALGSTVIRTPTAAAWDSPESLIGVAKRLERENPNHHILDQYNNPSNVAAHYDGTAEEIIRQCNGKIDMVIISTGTGGTMSGVARKLKEKIPGIVIVGVDPVGSLLADPEHDKVGSYKVEGIGYDFVPKVCHRDLVDKWVKTTDDHAFRLARELQREEGLLVGGSCGSVMQGLLEAAKDLRPDQRAVVIFPDNIRNYLSKFVDDDWMRENHFLPGEPVLPSYDALKKENEDLKKRIAELEGKSH